MKPLALLALVLSLAWTAVLSIESPIGCDGGYYLMVSREVAAGGVPYAQLYTVYTPGYFYTHLLYEAIFGRGPWALQAELWAHALVLALMLAWVMRRLCKLSFAPIALALAAFFPLMAIADAFTLYLEMEVNLWGWLGLGLAIECGRRLTREGAPAAAHGVEAASLGLAFAAGCAAGGSFWCKQVGGVFGLLAIAVPAAMAGRLDRRVVAATILGHGVAPALFFLAIPEAAWPFVSEGLNGLLQYAGRSERYVAVTMRHLPWMLLHWWWVPALLWTSGLETLQRCSSGRRTGVDTTLALLYAGALIYFLPFASKGYPHYLQLVLPLLIVVLTSYWCALAGRRRQLLVHLVVPVLALATTVGEDLRSYQSARLERPSQRERELRIGRWIEERSAGHREIFILLASPQYYVLSNRFSASGQYLFLPSEEHVRKVVSKRAPVFFVLRPVDDVTAHRKILEAAGYRPADRLADRVELWLPPGPS